MAQWPLRHRHSGWQAVEARLEGGSHRPALPAGSGVPPGEFFDLAVLGMFGVETAKFEFGTGIGKSGADPAAGAAGFEDVGGGREVDEFHAMLMAGDMPVVGMAVDIGFHLAVAGEEFFHGRGILQAAQRTEMAEKTIHFERAAETGDFHDGIEVVMTDDDGGAVGPGVEFAGEPLLLVGAEEAGALVGRFQGIEEEPVVAGGGKDADLLGGDGGVLGGVEGEGLPEGFAVVVVAKEEVDGSEGADGGEEFFKGGVIAGGGGVKGEVAAEHDGGGGDGPGEEFLDDGGEVGGHVHAMPGGGGVGGDMGVGEEENGIRVARFRGESGEDGGSEGGGQPGEGGAFQELAAVKLGQAYRHSLHE